MTQPKSYPGMFWIGLFCIAMTLGAVIMLFNWSTALDQVERLTEENTKLQMQVTERNNRTVEHRQLQANYDSLKKQFDEHKSKPLTQPTEAVAHIKNFVEPVAPDKITNSIGMKLILVKSGTFKMGPAAKDGEIESEQFTATLTQDYYLGTFEVTQEEYQRVMGKNPSKFSGTGKEKHPVENVSWQDAVDFCNKLSALPFERAAGRVYRLPTEAEWEYACRAGTDTKYFFGDDGITINDYAWSFHNSGDKPLENYANNVGELANLQSHPVGQKKPNPRGFYDVYGNVGEWCADYHGNYPKGKAIDPIRILDRKKRRSVRGGSYLITKSSLSSRYRDSYLGTIGSPSIGIRVAITVPQPRIANSIGMKLVRIPSGFFQMGSPDSEASRSKDEVSHGVTLTENFFMGVTEVTQADYQIVMGRNPSAYKGFSVPGRSADYPVEMVSWNNATEFCRRLSALPAERLAGRVYRLPTEAEWEYACRAGTETEYYWGVKLQDYARFEWWWMNSGLFPLSGKFDKNLVIANLCRPHPVASKEPNPWGLYDINGNVAEWCTDWYTEQLTSATNPTGPNSGEFRVYRGGSHSAGSLRAARRYHFRPEVFSSGLGFRVVMTGHHDSD